MKSDRAPNENRAERHPVAVLENPVGSEHLLRVNRDLRSGGHRQHLHPQDLLGTPFSMQKMLKCENIQYKVYPVTTYSEIEQRVEEARVYEKVRMFMFINCGGIMDLTETWIVQQKQAQIFLFDVNKPINHKNLESPDVPTLLARSRSSTMGSASSRTVPLLRRCRSMTSSTSMSWTRMRGTRMSRWRVRPNAGSSGSSGRS